MPQTFCLDGVSCIICLTLLVLRIPLEFVILALPQVKELFGSRNKTDHAVIQASTPGPAHPSFDDPKIAPKPPEPSKEFPLLISSIVAFGIALMAIGAAIPEAYGFIRIALFEIGVVTAVVFGSHLIYEHVLKRDTSRMVIELVAKSLPTAQQISDQISEAVRESVAISREGLTLISSKRRGLPQYYDWLLRNTPDEVRIGGRSCLHRIEDDMKERTPPLDVVQLILNRLWQGCSVEILFHDPRSGLVASLAADENRDERDMLEDIARSLGICRRLYWGIQQRKDEGKLPKRGGTRIFISKFQPAYAYQSYDGNAIVGFYFPKKEGFTTAAWLATGSGGSVFHDGYSASFAKAEYMLETDFDHRRVRFNDPAYNEIRTLLIEQKGFTPEEMEQLMPMAYPSKPG